MAYHFTEFYKAVYDRFDADATLGNLIDGVWSVRAPDTADAFVVTSIETAGTEDEAFRTLARTYRLLLTTIVPSESVGSTDPLDILGQIADRLEGNWYAKAAGVAPDYGLARWQPTLTSWDCTPLELIDIQTLDGGVNKLALGMAFEVHITKEGA